MINKIAQKIVEYYVRKNKINEDKIDIYIYCFELLLSTIFNLMIILTISVATGLYIEGTVFSVCFMAMRSLAGGYHSNSHMGCLATLLLIFTGYVLIYKLASLEIIFYLSIAMLLLSLIIPFLAPIDSVNKPLTIAEYRKNKKKSILAYVFFIVIDITLLVINATRKYSFAISYPLFAVCIMLLVGYVKNKYDYKKIEDAERNN